MVHIVTSVSCDEQVLKPRHTGAFSPLAPPSPSWPSQQNRRLHETVSRLSAPCHPFSLQLAAASALPWPAMASPFPPADCTEQAATLDEAWRPLWDKVHKGIKPVWHCFSGCLRMPSARSAGFGRPNGPNGTLIRAVWPCKTDCLAVRNGPSGNTIVAHSGMWPDNMYSKHLLAQWYVWIALNTCQYNNVCVFALVSWLKKFKSKRRRKPIIDYSMPFLHALESCWIKGFWLKTAQFITDIFDCIPKSWYLCTR